MKRFQNPEDRLKQVYNNDALIRLLELGNNREYKILKETYEGEDLDGGYEEVCDYVIINKVTDNAFEFVYSYTTFEDFYGLGNADTEYFALCEFIDAFDKYQTFKDFELDLEKIQVNLQEYRNKFLDNEPTNVEFSGNELNYEDVVKFLNSDRD